MTLEERVAALESGELARLRVMAQRRLEKLRIERAAVAELRGRLGEANDAGEAVKRLRNYVAGTTMDDAADVVAGKAITELLVLRSRLDQAEREARSLRELVDERDELAKEIGRLRDELADVRAELAKSKALANVLEPLRATLPTAPDTAPSKVVAIAIERIEMLRELVNSERKASMKEFSRLQDDLADAKAKLAKATAPPTDDRLGWFNR